MTLIRAFLNNGFFFLVLIVAVTLYLVYSDKVKHDHGLLQDQHNNLPNDTTESTDLGVPTTIESSQTPEPISVADKVEEKSETNVAEVVPTDPISTEAANNPEPASQNTTEQTPILDNVVDATESTVENTAEESIQDVVETANQVLTPEPAPVATAQAEEAVADKVNQATVAEPSNPVAITSETPPASINLPAYDQASLDAILNDTNITKGVPEFDSIEAAYSAARQAFYDKDYATSQKIYFSMVKKNPTANALGELGNVLFMDNKLDWANRSWLESAKYLIKEKRIEEAYTLANRLHPVAPATAQKIAYQLSKFMANQYSQQQLKQTNKQQGMPAMQPYRSQPMPVMPNWPNSTAMQQPQGMQPMPMYPPVNIQSYQPIK